MLSKIIKSTVFLLFTISLSPVWANVSTLPSAEYVLPQKVKTMISDGKKVVLIDVREPSEYKAGHLDGAINIPYLDVEKNAKRFDKETPHIFYCTYSAWRAPYAANVMADLGFKNAFILEGGVSAWKAGGQVIYASFRDQEGKIIPYPESMAKVLYHPKDKTYSKKIYLTLADLRQFNGQDGRPAYVAVNGTIYDLTQSRLWRGGEHAPSHGQAMAGQDLTEVLKDSPHGDKHLKDFPVVGWLVAKE
jgi:predicted heme/steroid binding protein/rhodanese-related sulfurtransferase